MSLNFGRVSLRIQRKQEEFYLDGVGCPALLLIPTLVFHGLHTVSTFRPPVRVTAGVGLRECGGTARIVDFSSAGALTCTHNFFTSMPMIFGTELRDARWVFVMSRMS
jgi:hypothetical protein